RGRLRLGNRRIEVQGASWLDREWSSSALAADQQGWDWFALQFDDNTELMFYQIRRSDGSRDPMSAGTRVEADGSSHYLRAGDVELTVLDHWDSPAGGRYPAGWRLLVPRLDLDVRVVPVFADQELDTAVRYWEGAVDVNGRSGDRTVGGHGYVELTGYAEAPSRQNASD
ncbi:MAG: lipocalin family protein, partial [Woeseiaceae bacterium]|nr:lipocalin family protein [Woeseiaceae bacterium]